MPARRTTPAETTAAARRTVGAKPARSAETLDDARRKRAQEYLAKWKAREAELKAQGYCF